MAVSDLDIYRSAKLLIGQHGENADLEASRMFDLMTTKGDVAGCSVWRRIGDAIKFWSGTLTPEKQFGGARPSSAAKSFDEREQ